MRTSAEIALRAFFLLSLFLLPPALLRSYGQARPDASVGGIDYRREVQQLVMFLQYALNEVGSESVPVGDKEVIIHESFQKMFRDARVQIEDDLDENREVVTNKDVQAYLKDVDFFFRDVAFEFQIQDIREGLNESGQLFYTVKLSRRLKGTDINGVEIDNLKERFIEINVDETNRDLKIASIYTTRLSRTEELAAWWNRLGAPWKLFLGAAVPISPTHTLYDVWEVKGDTIVLRGLEMPDTFNIAGFLRQLVAREELDISNTRLLTDLSALDEMNNLRVLNLSNTETTDLFPVRNLTRLEVLDLTGTLVEDLNPLRYSRMIRELSISSTPIHNIAILENLQGLEKLNLSRMVIDSLPSVESLGQLKYLDLSSTNLLRLDSVAILSRLEYLDVSNTAVAGLNPVSGLKNLKYLAFNETAIQDISPLAALENLETVSFFNTPVSSLEALIGLGKLRKVYCDGSAVTRDEFAEFYRQRPDCEVIFSSDQLMEYWTGIDREWKDIIMDAAGIDREPNKEMLHEIFRIQSVDLSGRVNIKSLDPLAMLIDLRSLRASGSGIDDVSPLRNQTVLEYLDCSQTSVSDLSPLSGLVRLRVVRFDDCPVTSIDALAGNAMLDSLFFNSTGVSDIRILDSLPSFKAAYFDDSQVTETMVRGLAYDPEKSVVVFRSKWLSSWWDNLPGQWQDLFRDQYSLDLSPSPEVLHQLTSRVSLELNTLNFNTIGPVSAFFRLRKLRFSDSRVSSLHDIRNLELLEELHCTRNPIADLDPVRNMAALRVLNIENTLVRDLSPISGLVKLEELNCAGTDLRNLNGLSGLSALRILDISNTRVNSLKPILGLSNMEVLRCYSTRLKSRAVDEFRALYPNCEIVYY